MKARMIRRQAHRKMASRRTPGEMNRLSRMLLRSLGKSFVGMLRYSNEVRKPILTPAQVELWKPVPRIAALMGFKREGDR